MEKQKENANRSSLEVMNFLNEIASRFPKAVSFASGRPAEQFFDTSAWFVALSGFAAHFSQQHDLPLARVNNLLAQYGKTAGIIGDLIARHLRVDEAIECVSEQVIVTTGCQEAIELAVRTLCTDEDDVVIARTPTYIGITGVCELSGIEMASFKAGQHGVLDGLQSCVMQLEARGKKPKILYLIPEFDNPTGEVIPEDERVGIIDFCASKKILILEDNPYGMYRFEGVRNRPLFALDKHGCVIYLGTFSKTICPSLRVGFAVLPASLLGSEAESQRIRDEISQRKSFVTVNTSQIAQAIVGGILLREECSLARLVSPAVDFYKANRDEMVRCLDQAFGHCRDKVDWNTPAGGFFLTVRLPFAFKSDEALICAKEFGVLVMPLSFFALDDTDDNSVRLAFSYVDAQQIGLGVRQFAQFVLTRMQA